jgi:ABC-type amino acid transport substrate-binding protein
VAVPIRNYVSESKRTLAGVVVLIGVLIALEGCGSSTQVPVAPEATVANETKGALFATGDCAPANLTTRDAGHLNVGYSRARAPYFIDRTPADPVGFEVAVVNEIARKLGFDSNQVQWKKVVPAQLTAPTREDLDFGIGANRVIKCCCRCYPK